MQVEYWAHHYETNKATEEFEDFDFDPQAEIRRIEEEAEAAERAASAVTARKATSTGSADAPSDEWDTIIEHRQ